MIGCNMIENYFYNNWCKYINNNVIVQHYPKEFKHYTYKDALIQQAVDIYDSTKIKTIFISGGIDSQTKALGYILAGIDCKIVFIKNTFNFSSNNIELFYAKEFCKKYKKELNVFEVSYNKESLEEMLFEQNFFTSSVGTGNIFQYDAMKKYMNMYDEKIVVGIGYFFMNRIDNICFGNFLKPNFGLMRGIDLNRILLFDTYSPHIFKYYEYVHRNTPEIQFLKKYAGKNLSYVELGMPFRPKLSSWEFLDTDNDYFKLSSIDWSDDHSAMARLTTGLEVISKIMKYDKKTMSKIYESRKFNQEECYLKLYEFKTDVNYKV
jgi:hypothetical protein